LGLFNCSEELQLLEVSASILAPIDFLSNQKLSMVSCSDTMTGVLHRSGRVTLWGELPDNRTHLILERPCREIVVGGSFVCFVSDTGVDFWGRLGGLCSISDDYTNVLPLSDLSGSLVCSDGHLLLMSNGEVFALGVGEEGQLGLGEDTLAAAAFQLCELGHQAVQVLCNNEVSVALTREVIYVWGLVNPLQLNNSPRMA
jgi:alpha-tubulin suppressor-like RCC1 family protein